MTAALEAGEWSAARPGRTLPPGKTRYPLYRKLIGPQGLSGRAENLVPTAIFLITNLLILQYTNTTCIVYLQGVDIEVITCSAMGPVAQSV